jgi:hypothetical protein
LHFNLTLDIPFEGSVQDKNLADGRLVEPIHITSLVGSQFYGRYFVLTMSALSQERETP